MIAQTVDLLNCLACAWAWFLEQVFDVLRGTLFILLVSEKS